MLELFIILAFLCVLWAFGRCLLSCFKIEDDWLSMPLGLCLVVVISNILYFACGFKASLVEDIFLALFIPCILLIVSRKLRPCEWWRLLMVLGVFLFLALPAFIGGKQYCIFRGNHWDQFNYLNQTLVLWRNPYPVFHHFIPTQFLSQDVLIHGMAVIDIRPTVGLVLAMLLPQGIGDLHLITFLYVTALWSLFFPAICSAGNRLLELYKQDLGNPLFVIIPAFAYVVGFCGQYVFDINAWSQVAAMPLLLVFVMEYAGFLNHISNPSVASARTLASRFVLAGLLIAAAFLFYPEDVMMHAVFMVFATLIWCIAARKVLPWATFGFFVIFTLAFIVLSSVPDWNGTMGCALHQFRIGPSQTPVWWRYFDRYWLGFHGDVLFTQIKPAVVHGLSFRAAFHQYWVGLHIHPMIGYISTAANLILAVTGIFFITPDYANSLVIVYPWIALSLLMTIALCYTLARSIVLNYKRDQVSMFLKTLLVSGSVLILYFIKKHALWSFGKALTFLFPYLFLILLISFLENGKSKVIRGCVIVYIVGQIAFGVFRLCSAADPNGIGYNNLVYPSIQDTTMKTNYSWDMHVEQFDHCHGVKLFTKVDPFYLEFMKQDLLYRGIPYFSSLPVRSYYVGGDLVGMQAAMDTDCKMRLVKQDGRFEVSKE